METLAQRIHELLKHYELSPAQFADKIGVQRSSISHILSGRNKPSLDFVYKTLGAFPTLNTPWLLFGNGNIEGSETNPSEKIDISDSATKTPQIKNSSTSFPQKEVVEKVLVLYSDGRFQEFHS